MLLKCQNKNISTWVKVCVYVSGFIILYSVTAMNVSPEIPASSVQQYLSERFDPSAGNMKLKKWKIAITNEGFLRLWKYYPNGKQEYFSLSLKRFKEMDYMGTVSKGTIVLKTLDDDVIVQTFRDPKGNVDSMSSFLSIPLQFIRTEGLDSLNNNFIALSEVP